MARGKYHQSSSDRRDESRGMKKYARDYPSKESRAGHRYDESAKHRMRESEGMKKSMSHGGGHAHKEVHREKRDNAPMQYGSSNHGSAWGSEYHSGHGPYTMDDHKKDPGYEGGRIHAMEVAQRIEDWGSGAGNAMRQHESGSMDYLSDKNEIRDEDNRRISREMLPQ